MTFRCIIAREKMHVYAFMMSVAVRGAEALNAAGGGG